MGVEKIHIVVSDQQQVSIREKKRGFEGRLRNLRCGFENSSELVQHTAGRKKRHSPMRCLEPFQVVRHRGGKAGKHCGKEKRLNPDLGRNGLGVEIEKLSEQGQSLGRVVYLSPNIEPSVFLYPIIA